MKDTYFEDMVLDELKNHSSKNPLTRWQMKDLTKLSDVQNRQIIGALRDKGIRVINNSTGYWIGTDEEYKEWLPTYTAYAKTILHRVAMMNGFTDGQIGIEV